MGNRWKLEFEARLPSDPDRQRWTVGLAPRLLDALQRNGHAVKQMRILLVEAVLADPWAIFSGWSRPDTDGCFVYAGKPDHDFRGPGIEVPPPPGMMFLVFVLPDGTIDDWNWRKVNEDNPDLPDGINGRIVWQQT